MKIPFFNIQEIKALHDKKAESHEPILNGLSDWNFECLPFHEFFLVYKNQSITNLIFVKYDKENMPNTPIMVHSFMGVDDKKFEYVGVECIPSTLSQNPDDKVNIPYQIHSDRLNSLRSTDVELFFKLMEISIQMLILFLKFLNCKNIECDNYDPNTTIQMTRKQKKLAAHGRLPYVKYKILHITPVKKKQLDAKKNKLSNKETTSPLHTVRGHFKTYTRDKPLFGRLTGTFWWGPCVKGNPYFGVVEKDYHLHIKNSEIEKIMSEVGL